MNTKPNYWFSSSSIEEIIIKEGDGEVMQFDDLIEYDRIVWDD